MVLRFPSSSSSKHWKSKGLSCTTTLVLALALATSYAATTNKENVWGTRTRTTQTLLGTRWIARQIQDKSGQVNERSKPSAIQTAKFHRMMVPHTKPCMILLLRLDRRNTSNSTVRGDIRTCPDYSPTTWLPPVSFSIAFSALPP